MESRFSPDSAYGYAAIVPGSILARRRRRPDGAYLCRNRYGYHEPAKLQDDRASNPSQRAST
jgi:hypothetical protein